MTHYRIGDLGSEARAVVETLVGRGLGDEDRLGLVVIGDAPVPVSEAEEGERRRQAWLRFSAELDTMPPVSPSARVADDTLGERQRQARVRLMEELDALPVHNPDDGLSARDIDRVIYGVDR